MFKTADSRLAELQKQLETVDDEIEAAHFKVQDAIQRQVSIDKRTALVVKKQEAQHRREEILAEMAKLQDVAARPPVKTTVVNLG